MSWRLSVHSRLHSFSLHDAHKSMLSEVFTPKVEPRYCFEPKWSLSLILLTIPDQAWKAHTAHTAYSTQLQTSTSHSKTHEIRASDPPHYKHISKADSPAVFHSFTNPFFPAKTYVQRICSALSQARRLCQHTIDATSPLSQTNGAI